MNTKKAALTVLSIALKIVVLAVVVMGIYRLAGVAFDYGHSVFQEKAVDQAPGRNITVTIEEGASNRDIAELMEVNCLVEYWKLFFIQFHVCLFAMRLVEG